MLSLASLLVRAQTPAVDDFNPGVQGEVYAIATQPDGKILVGGTFDQMGGQPRQMIARLLPDGTVDPEFNPGADRPPLVFAVQPDGKIIVGGSFLTLAGQARRGLARLNPDGTLDGSFAAETAGDVYALFLLPDGKILVGGGFTALAGGARANLGRLNPDGTLDPSFRVEADRPVSALAMQPDGRLLVGGSFVELGGQPRARLGRLLADGTVDPDFHPTPGPGDRVFVNALVAQADGHIVVGGDFMEMNGEPRENLARLNADGSLDLSMHVEVDTFVTSLLGQADGGVIVGGNFIMFGPGATVALGRLKPDGSVDADFTAWAEFTVEELLGQSDGKILVGGMIHNLSDQGRNGIGRLEAVGPVSEQLSYAGDTLTWRRQGPGTAVWRATFEFSVDGQNWTVLGDGERIDGGWERRGVALPEGAWARVRGEAPGARGFVIAWLGPPMLLDLPQATTARFGENASFGARVGGSEPLTYQWTRDGQPLTDRDGVQGVATPVLRLRGVTGAAAGEYRLIVRNALGEITSPAATLTVADPLITRQPADQIVQPGGTATFSVEATGSAPLTYQWRKDGEPLTEGGRVSGVATPTLTITEAEAGDEAAYSVVVGNAYGTVTSRDALLEVAAVTVDPHFNVAVAQFQVDALLVQPDGRIVVAGFYQYLAGTERFGIGRLQPDGTVDTTFSAVGAPGGRITTLGYQTDGKIVVGGRFSGLAGAGWQNLGRLNPDGTADAGFVGNANDWVYCLALQPDGRVVIGGDFSEVNGLPSWHVARLNPDGTPDAGFASTPGSLGWWKASVHALAIQPDGRILLGGWSQPSPFKKQYHLERLLPDGTLDPTFTPTVDNWVEALLVQPDGRILAAGQFTSVNGQARARIVRLEMDGSLDPNFGAAANGDVLSLALQADGKILLGGNFTELNGEAHPNIGRLNRDGSVDPSFGLGTDGSVLAVALDADGGIYAGGGFGRVDGEKRTLLARLLNTEPAVNSLTATENGLTWVRGGTAPAVAWAWFDTYQEVTGWTLLGEADRTTEGWELAGVSVAPGSPVRARGQTSYSQFNGGAAQVEAHYGRLLVLGEPEDLVQEAGSDARFRVRAVGSEPASYQWRKDDVPLPEGEGIVGVHTPVLTLSNVWGPAAGEYSVVVSNDFGEVVSPAATLTVTGDPKITSQPSPVLVDVGGRAEFSVEAVGTAPLSYQWRKDGVDLPQASEPKLVLANVRWADGGLYTVEVSNAFGSVTSEPAELQVNLAGLGPGFAEGVQGRVYALALQPDGKVLVGGQLGSPQSAWPGTGLARFSAAGVLEETFAPKVEGTVRAIQVESDGDILLGGAFNALDGEPRLRLARLSSEGELDASFNPGADAEVFALAVQPDGKLIVAGSFGELAGTARPQVGRLNPDGTLDITFDPAAKGVVFAPNSALYSVALQPDGRLLLGGAMSLDGDVPRHSAVRLNPDGSLDESFICEVAGSISVAALQADGRVVVGGRFAGTGVARLNSDGSLDRAFAPQISGAVYSIAVQTDGNIFVGGEFNLLNGQQFLHVARLHPDGTVDASIHPTIGKLWQQSVYALALESDGDLIVAGNFDETNHQPRSNLARLRGVGETSHFLTSEGDRLVWRRSGAELEVAHAVFAHSEDGAHWVELGEGLRIPGGWEWSGGAIPQGGSLQAHGRVAGGIGNSSGWLVADYAGAPVIVGAAEDTVVRVGGGARLRVKAAGSPPLHYQWLLDGAPLADNAHVSGVTTATLTLTNLSGLSTGRYQVVVTNDAGRVLSSEAVVTVLDPWISQQPASQVGAVGGSVTLSAEAVGTEPMTFQWFKDGEPVLAANGATITLGDLEVADAGRYRVRVTGPYGEALSEAAAVSVNGAFPDPTFQGSADHVVEGLAMQPDGKILLGGSFGRISGVHQVGVGRMNPSGLMDEGFTPELAGLVRAVTLDAGGSVLIGGRISTLADLPFPNLGRLNPDGSVVQDFAPAVDGVVTGVTHAAGDTLLVGGDFSSVGGEDRRGIARIHEDGTLDSGFVGRIPGFVDSVIQQPDGKILVSGPFNLFPSASYSRLVRLNPDGTLDETFNLQPNAPVSTVLLAPDGSILLGGSFTRLDGQPREHIARLYPDGTLDSKFDPGADSDIYSIVLQANGKILVGGRFTRLAGEPRAYLGRLNADGTLDLQFNPRANKTVEALALESDGDILVGGRFTVLAGQPQEHIGRLLNPDPAEQRLLFDGATVTWRRTGATPEIEFAKFEYSTDGANWTLLPAPTRIAEGWELRDVSVPAQAVIRARGRTVGGRRSISRGQVASYWGAPVLLSETSNLAKDLGDSVSLVLVAGGSEPLQYQWFKDGVPLTDDQRVHGTDGPEVRLDDLSASDAGQYSVTVSNAFGTVTSAPLTLTVNSKPVLQTGPEDVLGDLGGTIGFSVEATGSAPLSYQWRKDGEPLADGDHVTGATTAVLTLSDLTPDLAGAYTVTVSNPLGEVISEAATLVVNTALLDPDFAGEVFPSGVICAIPQPDGKIVVGGSFRQLNGSLTHAYLGRLNPDGTLDTGFDPAPNYTVRTILVLPDGRLLVGGEFTQVGTEPRSRLARINPDGSLDAAFQADVNAPVYALALQADGKILVGGVFTSLGGNGRHHLARLDADGALDADFSPGVDGDVYAIAVQPDGRILVGGGFVQAAGSLQPRLARILPDGRFDGTFAPSIATSGPSLIHALLVEPDGQILVGGGFSLPNDQPRKNLVRLRPDGSLDTGFAPDPDGEVYTLALQADGDILVGGRFTEMGGQPRIGIARLNAAGELDPYFRPETSGRVWSLTVQPDGGILAGGSRLYLGRLGPKYFVRLLPTGPVTDELTRTGDTLTWRRGGVGPEVVRTTFEHSPDGGITWNPLGEGARTVEGWELTGAAVPPAGSLRARGWVRGGQYSGSSWTTEAFTGAPLLLAQPQGQTRDFGGTVSFLVAAVGTPPLAYQWHRNGEPLADDDHLTGAQASKLTIADLSGADAGDYTVTVRNADGSATSEPASLVVVDPLITELPVSQTWGLGQSATFQVMAVGTEPLSYQWWKDGAALPGATETTLALSNLQPDDAGDYHVVVSNGHGSVASPVVTLTLVSKPTILRQPISQRIEPGQDGVLSVEAVGIEPLHYQWWKDVAPVPDATAATLELSEVQGADAGFYHVVVSNSEGETASDEVALLVNLATPDTDFIPEINGPRFVDVDALALQPGGMLVGGQFDSLGGQPRQSLGWLDLDGSVSERFTNGVNIGIRTLAVQPEGKVVVGGFFTELAGEARYEIGRLLSDGSLDAGFTASSDSGVLVTLVQPDGKILLGGKFLKVNDESHLHIARLNADGSLDPEFKLDRVSGDVVALAWQPDGKILLGGSFKLILDDPQAFLGRLNPDGSRDVTFAPQLDGYVTDIVPQPDGNLLLGGGFHTVNGQPAEHIARLRPDGSLDPAFAARMEGRSVDYLVLQADGRILVGGDFLSVNGVPQPYVARLNSDGSLDLTFAPDLGNRPYSLALEATGRVLVGGRCLMALADPCTVLQRLFNPDPATQELASDGSAITWLRGGSSPEAWRVTFAHTADGVNWSSLGEPVRIAGGWELTGAALPDQGTIRARAYARNGAGSGFVETLLTLGEAPEIRILAEDAGFGPDGFQFTVAGPVGATLVVEVSDNLTDWTEQGTLQLDGEADTFRDAEAAASGARFYRVRLAP